MSSSKRINLLSQLLRPSKIIKIGGFGGKRPNFLIYVSFTGDRIVIAYGEASYYKLIIYDFNPDFTIAGEARKELYYSSSGKIESISFSSQKFILKLDESYYEFNHEIETSTGHITERSVSLNEDFSKTNVKNIIQCGIYDIIVYEKHVKLFNNINPLNE